MFKSVALSACLIAGANAFWRMECPGRVALGRMDPIVNPGDASSHVHTIHGSSGFTEDADTSKLQNGQCTSCRVTQDKSAYWTPPLYFQDASTGKYEIVPQVGGMLAYYLLYGNNITAFPDGFRMISGSNDRRSYTVGDPNKPDPDKSQWAALGQTKQTDLEQRAIGFNCLNYGKTPEGTLYRHYLPDKAYLDANCKDGIRFELMFPSCWKGGNAVDSDNHKDHVAFPDLVMTGNCPSDYPARLPSMLFEVIWDTYHFANRNGRFVIANGDPTGYGFHGDFMTGWKEDFLQQAVNTCTNPSGRIEDCPLFNVVDQGTATSCKMANTMPQPLLSENVLGPRAGLPGGVKVTGDAGTSEDNSTSPSSSTPVAGPTLSYRPGEQASMKASPLPGQIFKAQNEAAGSAGATKPQTSAVKAQTTQAPAPASPSQSYVSTQYITNGNMVTEILWAEDIVTVTQGINPGAQPTPAGHKRHVHFGGHAHHKH